MESHKYTVMKSSVPHQHSLTLEVDGLPLETDPPCIIRCPWILIHPVHLFPKVFHDISNQTIRHLPVSPQVTLEFGARKEDDRGHGTNGSFEEAMEAEDTSEILNVFGILTVSNQGGAVLQGLGTHPCLQRRTVKPRPSLRLRSSTLPQ